MADVESASSSSVSQPPTSTSHINPIIPLIAADIHVEQQSASSSSAATASIIGTVGSGGGGGNTSSSVIIGSSDNASPASSSSTSSTSSSSSGLIISTSNQSPTSGNVTTVTLPGLGGSPNVIQATTSNNNSANIIIGTSNNNNVIVGGGSAANVSSNAMNPHPRKINRDDNEPESKKMKLDQSNKTTTGSHHQIEKLESRLLSALCCAVCLDLPKTAMYQCQMGHLMCAACFSHLLADGRLRDQIATCPNCRIEISKSSATRNLAVEKAASELPSECQYCNIEYPYKSLERHEQHECQERPTPCKFNRIGCPWRGPAHETTEHEGVCSHPHKSGYEVMSALEAHDAKLEKDKKVFSTLIDLLSYEKIIFNDLQLKPYRTDEYVHKLYYETSRFSAFNQQWVVKSRINNSQRDPHQSNERTITYQLILKTKTSTPMSIHFFALKGPFSDMKVGTQIYKHDFTDQSPESDYYHLPLPDSSECNRLLSNKAINLRLLMFLLSK